MKFKINVSSKKDGVGEDQKYEFPPQRVKIGRLKDNDIVLNFPAVSGYHGKLRLENNGKPRAYITDFGSLNGIVIDGSRIEPNQETEVQFNKPIELCVFQMTISPEVSPEERRAASQEAATMPLAGVVPLARLKDEDKDEQEEAAGKNSESKIDKPEPEKENEKEKDQEKGKPLPEKKEEKTEPPPAAATEKSDADTKNDPLSKKGDREMPAIKLKAGESTFDEIVFEAEELFTILGTVLSKGKPLAGVSIDAGDFGKFETSEDGTFSFEDIAEGTEYEIAFAKPDYDFKPETIKGKAEEDLALDIEAQKMILVNGSILHQGKPLAGVEVNAGPFGMCQSQTDGVFSLGKLPDGSAYELRFKKQDYKFEPAVLQGQAGDRGENKVEATKLVVVKGRVMHKGKPLEGVEIDAGPLGKTTTDANGVYIFKDVSEDTEFTITARKPKFNLAPQAKK